MNLRLLIIKRATKKPQTVDLWFITFGVFGNLKVCFRISNLRGFEKSPL
jgi:hypothetical protein